MFKAPTTIEQQIEFVNDMRESFDSEERQRIALIREPQLTAQLLKDIHEVLTAKRNWDAANKAEHTVHDADLCTDCNKPLTVETLADAERYDVVLEPHEQVHIACADKRLERLEQTSMGLP